MAESPTPSKFIKWKRPLIGGGISALVALAIMVTYYQFADNLGFGGLVFSGFIGIPFFVLDSLLPTSDPLLMTILAVGIWFGIGAIIARSVKSNTRAVSLWILVWIILTVVSAVAIIGDCCSGG